VTQTSQADGFSLHIVRTGTTELSSDNFSATQLEALSLLVCPAEHSLQNILDADQHCLMSFAVVFDGPMRPGKRKALIQENAADALIDKAEKIQAGIWAKVEHPFRVIKRQFEFVKVRFRGLQKNTA